MSFNGNICFKSSKVDTDSPIMLLERLLPQNSLRPHHTLGIEPGRTRPHMRRDNRLCRHGHPALHIPRELREARPTLARAALVVFRAGLSHIFELDGGGL